MSAATQRVEDLPPSSDKRHYYVRPVQAGQRGCLHGLNNGPVCGRPPEDRTVHLPPPGRSADL